VVLLAFAKMEHNTCGLEVLVICQKNIKRTKKLCVGKLDEISYGFAKIAIHPPTNTRNS